MRLADVCLPLNGVCLWPHLLLAALRRGDDAIWANVDRWRSIVFGANAPCSRTAAI